MAEDLLHAYPLLASQMLDCLIVVAINEQEDYRHNQLDVIQSLELENDTAEFLLVVFSHRSKLELHLVHERLSSLLEQDCFED